VQRRRRGRRLQRPGSRGTAHDSLVTTQCVGANCEASAASMCCCTGPWKTALAASAEAVTGAAIFTSSTAPSVTQHRHRSGSGFAAGRLASLHNAGGQPESHHGGSAATPNVPLLCYGGAGSQKRCRTSSDGRRLRCSGKPVLLDVLVVGLAPCDALALRAGYLGGRAPWGGRDRHELQPRCGHQGPVGPMRRSAPAQEISAVSWRRGGGILRG
jgi:hypothetical protein